MYFFKAQIQNMLVKADNGYKIESSDLAPEWVRAANIEMARFASYSLHHELELYVDVAHRAVNDLSYGG